MTLVDADTGAVLSPLLSEEQARRIVARINGTTAELVDLIEEAWRGRAWVALGYESWADLCDAEIQIPRLDRERRVEMVGALRSVGMSTRAIAAATGSSKGSVGRDLDAGAPFGAPASSSLSRCQVAGHGWHGDGPCPGAVQSTTTGTDGKTYTAKSSKSKPKRSALPDSAQKAGWEFRKAVERVERICDDDRFSANREQVAAHLRGHLSYAVEVCQDLLDRLDHQSQED